MIVPGRGAKVGPVEGLADGIVLGMRDGESVVGERLGKKVGPVEGLVDGCDMEGARLGDTVGFVGDTVGDTAQ